MMTIIKKNNPPQRWPSSLCSGKKRKAIPKAIREKVHAKYNGRCAYCGIRIEYKGMNVDHIKPVELGGTDDYENLNPSCRRCNNFKLTWTIEEFRYHLSQQVIRARKSSVNFRNAERFGLIRIIERPIIFYFEKCGNGGKR